MAKVADVRAEALDYTIAHRLAVCLRSRQLAKHRHKGSSINQLTTITHLEKDWPMWRPRRW